MVVVVTGEAAVGGGGEPGWGRRREVGAERGPRRPARSHGKMRQESVPPKLFDPVNLQGKVSEAPSADCMTNPKGNASRDGPGPGGNGIILRG